jgi:DNA polymerase III delta subunit
MIYLFLGEDTLAKDAKIAELKKNLFPSPEALSFDYELLDAHKLDPENLKKTLLTLPALVKKRLILIRNCHQLKTLHKDLIVRLMEKFLPYAVLILDSNEWEPNDDFLKNLKNPRVVSFSSARKCNVFDMTKAMESRNETEALKILDQLLGLGLHPLQIMGGLVWWWSKSRVGMPLDRFEKGLVALQETDLNIKRSRLKPEYALEVLVVRLCSSIGNRFYSPSPY